MRIDSKNKKIIDKEIYVHDSTFYGFLYDNDEKTLLLKLKNYYLITIPSNLDKSKACSVLTISPVNLSLSTTIPEISSLEKSILFKLTLINEERIIEESFTEKRESLQSSKLVFLTDDSIIEKSFKLELLKLA